jgi:hypothetical protein
MIIAANQPYFCPFPGFFAKAAGADVLVILDEVQFPRGATWITRNRFKNDQGALWLTVPVWKKGLGLQTISQVRLCYDGRWPRKHLASLKSAYRHAPYLAEHLPFLMETFSRRYERLLDLNLAIIRYLMQELELDTKLVLLSELGVEGRGLPAPGGGLPGVGSRDLYNSKPGPKTSRCRAFLPSWHRTAHLQICSTRLSPTLGRLPAQPLQLRPAIQLRPQGPGPGDRPPIRQVHFLRRYITTVS